MTKPSASVATIPNLESEQPSGTVRGSREVQEKDTSTRTSEDRMSDGEVEEDIMDISPSDVDEAELSIYSPKAVTNVQDASSFIDEDENYEPPSEISVIQRQERDPDTIPLSQDVERAEIDLPAQTQNKPSAKVNAESIGKPTSGDPSPAASINTLSDEQSRRPLSRNLSPANASDPDDYEPPEPATLGDEVPRSTKMSSVDTETPFSPRDVGKNNLIANASLGSVPVVDQQVSVDANTVGARFSLWKIPFVDAR